MPSSTRFVVSALTIVVTLAACSSAELPRLQSKRTDGASSGSFGGVDGTGSQPATSSDLAACATASAEAKGRPVSLVFMFDKSGSMIDDGKWTSAVAASKAFFESPQSAGVSAALGFFPDGGLGGILGSCDASFYASPRVALTNLPSTKFGQMLDQQIPIGTTPTHPALEGALKYAQQLQVGIAKNDKVAVVLVTDGEPLGCSGNDLASVSALAAGVATTIPTYVIGVGDSLANLNQIAAAGGTKEAVIVSTSAPAEIQQAFEKAITRIKEASLACDYRIPAAPNGEKFDRTKVNVQHSGRDGSPKTVDYNPSCAGGVGWKYDDANTPTRVLFCTGTCDQITAQAGKIEVLFGCETRSAPVK